MESICSTPMMYELKSALILAIYRVMKQGQYIDTEELHLCYVMYILKIQKTKIKEPLPRHPCLFVCY